MSTQQSILEDLPAGAQAVEIDDSGQLMVPDQPAVGFIEGDGIGPDIWQAASLVLDGAVAKAYGGARRIHWVELLVGEKSFAASDEYLPERVFADITDLKLAIKGPLTTPVGGGFRSLNVTLRQRLDLYACIRPVKWLPGVPSPVKRPELVDMVIFRENTEDLYAGIEWPADSPEADSVIADLNQRLGTSIRAHSALGIKPMSEFGSKRLIRRALDHALAKNCSSLTLVHKGNIMKYTEGAFRDWGYELAAGEYGEQTAVEGEPGAESKVVIKDRIADNMFQQALLRPDEFSVLACPNLNGDYLSDALAAQVGGLGMAPGANIGDEAALFEATHGSAPKYAGLDKVNPGSLILSGVMLLGHMGWSEAAELIRPAMSTAVQDGVVTYDLARQLEGAQEVSCSAFAQAVVERL